MAVESLTLLSPRFRNVVFPPDRRRRRPLNLALPTPVPSESRDETRFSGEQVALVDWLFARAGLDPRAYRPETLMRRLPSCLRLLRAANSSQARRVLEDNPGIVPAAVNVMLVGVTAFFRDPDLFEWLGREVFAPRDGARPGLNVWSAGCSEGAEVYSIAMLLAECGRLEDSYLLGTDCRAEAIQRARDGVFDAESTKGVPAGLLERHFDRVGGRWRVRSALRRHPHWAVSDLLKTVEPGVWDVIFFRNTAMYFRSEVLGALWSRIEGALRPGGLLVLGRAERPNGSRRLCPVRPCVFRRVRG